MTIKVIGAGMGRTGTLTLKAALEILGFAKCYHMVELLQNSHHVSYWEAAIQNRTVDWETLFTGYQATVDFPGYPHYKKILAHYPQAKVILTVRDADAWYESTKSTIFKAAPAGIDKLKMLFKLPFSRRLRQIVRIFQMADRKIWQTDFEGKFLDRDLAIAKFQAHIEDVKQTVPANQLLVYEVSQGWQPLCTFLGVPIPDQPFPYLNKREDFAAMAGKLTQV